MAPTDRRAPRASGMNDSGEDRPVGASAPAPPRACLARHRVLAAAGDPRAGSVLDAGHRLFMEWAAKIEDEGACRSFLEKVPSHRDLIERWRSERA